MPKKTNLIRDTEAASEIIGLILLVAVFVTFYTLFQATAIPIWNKNVESDQIEVTYNDMMSLPSDIEDVAVHGTPKSCIIQLGAHYPDRMIFRNPGPGVAGSLTVEDGVQVDVTYTDDSGTHTESYNSSRITYEMAGTINSPKLVYEHGVIITDWGTATLTRDEQSLIANEDIHIPVVNGTTSTKSVIGAEPLEIKPYSHLPSTGDIQSVNVSLDTNYPDLWAELLDDYISQGMVSISDQSNKIYINSSATQYLKVPDQIASGPLYTGMITCSVEDPDGGSNDGAEGVGDYSGTGDGVLTSGSQWWNIPSSADITEITLYNIVKDQAPIFPASLDHDFIWVSVTDDAGNWWKLMVEFQETNHISSIVARSGTTLEISTYSGTPFDFSSGPIDLLSTSNYDKADACYQNAGIGSNNCLVTYFGDGESFKRTVLVSYCMSIE